MPHRKTDWRTFLIMQGLLVAGLGMAWALAAPQSRRAFETEFLGQPASVPVVVSRREPLSISPLYDRPDLISDDDLAAVLKQVQPRFSREKLKPNHVEHALRVWGIGAEFADPDVLSGRELAEFLTDNGKYIASWGERTQPLLQTQSNNGVSIRWGMNETGGSVHHDHWLACLTEAGAPLDMPVYGPGRTNHTLANVLSEALRDFRLDEKETEWTAMSFGFWIVPTREWTGGDGRRYSFDLLAQRLMRGQKQIGVCAGTHRVYSLAVLLRLDDEYEVLSASMRTEIISYLQAVRNAITQSQFPDGHWPSNWPDGADAVKHPITEELYKQVIATGHHLEWMAIAAPELHVSDDQLRGAIQWVINTTKAQSQAEILQRYTFFSHVGNALALWRKTRPAVFWAALESTHAATIAAAGK